MKINKQCNCPDNCQNLCAAAAEPVEARAARATHLRLRQAQAATTHQITKFLLAISLFLLILAACGSKTDLNAPPEILYGQDPCDQCSMIINEPRFAASYVTTSGDVRRFDDLGGMLVYDQQHQEKVHIYWAHDFNTEEWLNAADASIVHSPELASPMAWGLAAFTNQADAEQFAADNNGIVTTFAALQQEIASGALDPAALSNQIHPH
ncbi:MAG: nitrous oxide reductase accessory protein NosL [Anaerolineae bacterium]|nr:nitrous oxide reductase accessory protein NosL [Anaerolineae bacterium]